jgi:outer membrane receptor protein involved in Fe transport
LNTTFKSDSVSGRFSAEHGEDWDLSVFGAISSSDGTSFPEDSGGSELAVIRSTDFRSAEDVRLGANGSVELSGKWRLNVVAGWYDHDASFVSPGVAPGIRPPVPPNGADSNLKRIDVAVHAVVELNDAFTATFGVDYYDEDELSSGFVEFAPGFAVPAGFEFDRSVTGGFGELHYKPGAGPTLLASVRRDDPNEERGDTTSELGFLYDFRNGRTSIRGNWGQGFSLPGFFALASPLVGNPNLRPETSESFDFGITHWSPNRKVGLSLVFFHNEFTDLIDFDTATFSMVNRDRLDTEGVELQLDYSVSDKLGLHAQATFMDLEFQNTTTPV